MSQPKISLEEVRRVAALARLALTDPEAAKMQRELDAILSHVEDLAALDLDGVEPTFHAVPMNARLRADEVAPTLSPEEALSQAPSAEGGAFAVPKVLEGES